MIRRVLPAILILSLWACEAELRPEAPAKPSSGRPAEPAAPPASPATSAGWTFEATEGEASLRFARDGQAVLRLWCTNADGLLRVHADGLTAIPSEERLTVGAGDEAHALVADLASTGSGVTASGPIPQAWMDAVDAGGPLSLSYGAQTLGPLDAVPAEERAAFTAECRAAVADE